MKKFQLGSKYYMKSICDSDCKWEYEVIKRTSKTVTLDNKKTFKIKEYDGSEFIKPLGSYSMAPILRADKEVI